MAEVAKQLDYPQKVLAYTKSLLRNSDKIVLFTESRNDDFLYEELLEDEKVAMISLRGKPKCKKCAELCYDNGISMAASFTDNDFDIFFPKVKFNHIHTDFYDLEAYSIFSKKWIRIIREIISIEQLNKKFGIEDYAIFRDRLVDICLPVGVIMYLVQQNKYQNIEFKKYSFCAKCKIPKSLNNTIGLVVTRLKNLNPKSIDSIMEAHLIKEGNNIINSISEQSQKQNYISSTMMSKCIISLAKTHSLFKSTKDSDGKKIEVLLNYLSMKAQFRSHVDETIFYNSQMYKNLKTLLKKYKL